jgi:small subunit ribosomal protein S6
MMVIPCFERSLAVHKEIIGMKPFIYETMYILRPDLGEEMTDQAIAKYQTILRDRGAQNIETQHRGKRRLAYEIGKHRDGVYVQMNYQAEGSSIYVLERAMRLSDEVIRYLTIKQDVPAAREVEEEAEAAQ